jgi:hypothetical protein
VLFGKYRVAEPRCAKSVQGAHRTTASTCGKHLVSASPSIPQEFLSDGALDVNISGKPPGMSGLKVPWRSTAHSEDPNHDTCDVDDTQCRNVGRPRPADHAGDLVGEPPTYRYVSACVFP